MRDFEHDAPAARIVLAPGSIDRVPSECARLGLRNVLVIAGGAAGAAGDRVADLLGRACAGRVRRVAQHVPEALAADAVARAKAAGADGLCCIGGGSATGLAKAVAVELDLAIVAVPTTYAGSEATAVYGITGERKRTASDERARPSTIIYDAALSTGLPARTSAASGCNALAHAVAALSGRTYDPLAMMYAAEAVRLISRALPTAVDHPRDLAARGDLLWASWLAGSALSATGTGLHHRLCHVLGGSYRLVHADVHAALLPHTVARDPDLDLTSLAAALGLSGADSGRVAATLAEFARSVGAQTGLAALGLPADRLDEAAHEAAKTVGGHDPSWFRDLLDQAYHPVAPRGGER